MPTPERALQWGDELSEERAGLRPDRASSLPAASGSRSSDPVRRRVIVIDPGDRRTGIAIATVAPGKLTKVKANVMPLKGFANWLAVQQGVCLPPRETTLFYDDKKPAFDIIVYETWRPRPIAGSMNWIQGNPLLTSQLIGMIRLIGWLSGAVLRGQGPDAKKAAFAQIESGMPGTAILRRRIHSSTEQHDKDALAHLWRYYREHWRV